jgi:hypothetical protein
MARLDEGARVKGLVPAGSRPSAPSWPDASSSMASSPESPPTRKTAGRGRAHHTEKFVSRGGYKLEHGLNHFAIDVAGMVLSTWVPPPVVSRIACCNAELLASMRWMWGKDSWRGSCVATRGWW